MADPLNIKELPAPARAAFVALATSGSLLRNIELERETDERKQPVWRLKYAETYKNQDLTPLVDVGILVLTERFGKPLLKFSEAGIDAWYAYSGLAPQPTPPADYDWEGSFDKSGRPV